MPPKRSKGSKKTTKSANLPSCTEEKIHKFVTAEASTQTEEGEIEKYNKEQIDVLQAELEKCKKELSLMKSENAFLKNEHNKHPESQQKQSIVNIKCDNKSPPSLTKNKGCNCKGNCSTKICGCVKKKLFCQDYCKCKNAQCKNHDSDKENLSEGLKDLGKNGDRVLEKLSLLSLDQENIPGSGKKNLNNTLFNKCDMALINCNRTDAAKRKLYSHGSNDLIDITNKSQNASATSPINTRENPKEPPKIYIENTDVSEIEDFRCKSVEVRNDMFVKKKRGSVKDQVESHPDADNYERDYLHFTSRNPKVQHSPPTSLKDLQTLTLQEESQTIKINQRQNLSSPTDTFINKAIQSIRQKNDDKRHKSTFPDIIPPTGFVRDCRSLTTPSKSDQSNEFLDQSSNPMIPKRQLARSPTGSISTPVSSKQLVPIEKPELAVEELRDWEQHQRELIKCRICHRKFFPFRINKHISSCKGI